MIKITTFPPKAIFDSISHKVEKKVVQKCAIPVFKVLNINHSVGFKISFIYL